MGTKIWTLDEKATLRSLAAKGYTDRQIAEIMGRSKSSIDQMVFKLNLHLHGREMGVRDHLAGNPFYSARQRAGLSREQAAERIGLTYHQIQTYELGRQLPSRLALWKTIAKVYGCTIGDLLGEEVLDSDERGETA